MERRSNSEILCAARLGIEAIAAQVRQNETRPGVRELAQHLITSDDRRVVRYRFGAARPRGCIAKNCRAGPGRSCRPGRRVPKAGGRLGKRSAGAASPLT